MGVNTFSLGHNSHSFGKTLNVLLSKCPESCGVLQMEVEGRGQFSTLLPLQSPFQGQSCCVCGSLSHSKSFIQWGTRKKVTTEFFKFCWGKIHNDFFFLLFSPLSPQPHLSYFMTQMIHLTFAPPPGGPRRHRLGARSRGP